ncbi:MAG: polysaccharide deacetylase family protein [Alphaproteobacteria bacterium]
MSPRAPGDGAQLLVAELDCWANAGARADIWLRDDDAVTATPALGQLLDLCTKYAVHPVVAVVPGGADNSLAAMLVGRASACVHGIDHKNHAGPGQKKQELHASRPLDEVLAQLKAGLAAMRARFGAGLAPVLVPPWNRIDPALLPHLAALGFVGLSTFKHRATQFAAPGLVQINTHVDLMEWGDNRRGRPVEQVAAALATALARARHAGAEPVGILSHHLVHDAQAFEALEMVLRITREHHGAQWCDANTLFTKVESL